MDLLSGSGVMSGEGASPDFAGRGVTKGLSISGLGVVEDEAEAIGRLGVIVLVDIVVVVVVVVTVVMGFGLLSECVCCRTGVRERLGRSSVFGGPKSSFLEVKSAFEMLESSERGFGERRGIPSLSKTRRLEGLRRWLFPSGRFLLLQLAGEAMIKSLIFKSDSGCLVMAIICGNS